MPRSWCSRARRWALLTILAPRWLRIDLHLDGALYPLLSMLSVALVAHAGDAAGPRTQPFGGVRGIRSVYCTFGLLSLVGMALLASLGDGARRYTCAAGGSLARRAPPRAGRAHMADGAVLPGRSRRVPSVADPKLARLFPMVHAARGLAGGLQRAASLSTLGISTLLGLLAAFQGTDEVARRWLCMFPPITLAVAARQSGRSAHARSTTTLHALAPSQLLVGS